eukprot:TRINITY_DN4933_c0_g1_i11.p1 TRINITY_DN4933_c0_g1~~TRINITY_DN4933_c0_g1_i11.p1  ORF type:complete len:198 (+),score=32.34 TRINITY_DN4933_c0_g1_i11:174-767(+)
MHVTGRTLTRSLARASTAPRTLARWRSDQAPEKEVRYAQLVDYSVDELFAFNQTHGSTPHNFIPAGPVREHLSCDQTVVWGGTLGDKLAGFITAGRGSEYWLATGPGDGKTAFIHEFVVDPAVRGMGLGTKLAKMSICPDEGIFGVDPAIDEIYTTVHADNLGSRAAFIKAGYCEVMTYRDAARDRNTTVLKATRGD